MLWWGGPRRLISYFLTTSAGWMNPKSGSSWVSKLEIEKRAGNGETGSRRRQQMTERVDISSANAIRITRNDCKKLGVVALCHDHNRSVRYSYSWIIGYRYRTSGTAGCAKSLFTAAACATSESGACARASRSNNRIHHCGGSIGRWPLCF